VELPPDAVAHFKAQAARQDFIVWADNWESLELFCACSTQWRYRPMGEACGIDYAAVRAVLQMRGTLDQGAAFDDVRLLEHGALAAIRGKSLSELING
jgi:hypothetical protein